LFQRIELSILCVDRNFVVLLGANAQIPIDEQHVDLVGRKLVLVPIIVQHRQRDWNKIQNFDFAPKSHARNIGSAQLGDLLGCLQGEKPAEKLRTANHSRKGVVVVVVGLRRAKRGAF